MFIAPTIVGERVSITPLAEADRDELAELDWDRAAHPAMAGWAAHPVGQAAAGTALLRSRRESTRGQLVGAIDAMTLPGYDGVANVSIFTDTSRAAGGLALEGYGLYVDDLFRQGARLIHHEVLSLNLPIRRAMRAFRLQPTATYRDHAYAAGRFWDVLVYSYGEDHWRSTLAAMPNNPVSQRVRTPLAAPPETSAHGG